MPSPYHEYPEGRILQPSTFLSSTESSCRKTLGLFRFQQNKAILS